MGKEEQVEEREVLESIFPDEIASKWQFISMRGSERAHGSISGHYSLQPKGNHL
jgi:hypothetical protein